MERMVKVLSVALLVSAAAIVADATTAVTPYLSYRSQSQDLARQKVGTIGHEYKADMDVHNGVFTITPEYTRSFHGKDIAQSLFGCYYLTSCNKLNITGASAASGHELTDLAAEWFNLPANYEGYITFEPVIQNFNADLSMYWGMDAWVKGMFARIHAPITWTKWDLGACFKTTVSGDDAGGVVYLHDAEDFFCGQKYATASTAPAYDPLNCARFCGCSCDKEQTKTRLADIQMDLGWNFLLDQDYNLGLFARVVAPTGNKVRGEWLFEPVIGNGHHWELGGGLTGSAILWRNQEENKHFGFYVDANVTHLFKTHQNRVFDLKGLPLSRYMFATNGDDSILAPIANLTSCKMDVYVPVQADVTAMFNYTSGNWSYDLGYNFWARSCEKFDCSCDDCCNDCDDCDCSSTCTPCCGQCIIKNGNEANWALTDAAATINNYAIAGGDVVITDTMVDYDGARTKGMSNKVFGNINYAWMDREVVPFIGLGGFAEFGRNEGCCSTECSTSCNDSCNSCSTSCCDDDCSCCKYASLSQWGLWLKGGVSF